LQTTTNNKGREGEAARNLIVRMPDLADGVLTTDALHLQEETIRLVVEDKHGHFLVGLKGNRETLLNEVKQAFTGAFPGTVLRDFSQSQGHGRRETRLVEIIDFETQTKYPHLQSAIRVTRTREIVRKGKTQKKKPKAEVSYYVATFAAREFAPPVVQGLIRDHWTIENRLHHVKDRTMQEDRYRARAAVGSNVALIRSVVVMLRARLAERDPRIKGRLRGNAAYAIDLLFHSFANE
jgi:predicted transposase YbfD/YdcC